MFPSESVGLGRPGVRGVLAIVLDTKYLTN